MQISAIVHFKRKSFLLFRMFIRQTKEYLNKNKEKFQLEKIVFITRKRK